MNEFIEQFVIESRENVEQGTADLLALEKDPRDAAVLDSAFRAFHTLKGSAGIVDFAAMADAVHAAEDVLSAIRAGSRAITRTIISDCVACLDQVSRWLDAMQSTGEVPRDAPAQAAVIVQRFGASSAPDSSAGTPPVSARTPWIEPLLAKHARVRATATTAVRYAPDPDCFLAHEDPLARIAALPGLLAVEVEPVMPWPPVDALDPYLCNIVIAALTRSSPADLSIAMGAELSRCEVLALVTEGSSPSQVGLAAREREVIEAQVALLRETGVQHRSSRAMSAGVVAAHVLRSSRRDGEAATIERLAQGDPAALLASLESLLDSHVATGRAAAHPAASQASARTLRVDSSRIDALVNVTGELIVAKNSIGHIVTRALQGDPSAATMLKDAHARLDGLVGELQQSVLGMRVLPLRHVFQRFPRMLREMGSESGKTVEMVVEGDDTEADKAIVEGLFEPLLHVLRNAVDHGVEDAAARRARGKPPIARIVLSAQRVGDQVVIEIRDDGGGIDLARVRAVALARQLVEPEALAARSDAEVVDLVFEPGFSTADRVTDLSGRGVGMDAVRTAVQRLGGRVAIETEAGRGTTVRFARPFNVLMTRVMLVVAGGQTFGVPLDAVAETLRLPADRLVRVGAAHALVHRNRTVPVVTLAQALGLPRTDRETAEATLVVTADGGTFGALWVDAIGEPLEVMLKPLEGLLAGTRGLAGSALLGDGSVLLVVDIGEVLR
jgi:two-component system chemotaxis sensor kinase CheA